MKTKMTTENAVTTTTHTAATLAAAGTTVASEKASAKKTTRPKKGAAQGRKPAKGGKPATATKSQKATPAKGPAPRATTGKAPKSAAPREGSKTAQVIAMLQRKNGATLAEIMNQMGWQKHTVRGFMAGAMKKAGYSVESFKPVGGERSYRLNQ
jgi:hypothetical protein